MTGLLTDLMRERADDLPAPHLDLAAIAREGDRRVRRRRTTFAGGLAAAAAVAAVAVPPFVHGGGVGDDRARHDVVADGTTADPQQLAWITGSTLHRPGKPDVDLGVDVRAWVWAGDHIVFTDPRRRVRVWDGGTVDDLGPIATPDPDAPELVADGTSVAWVSVDERVVRYDVAEGTLVVAPELPGNSPRVTAIDGADVYAVDTEGVYSWRTSAPASYRTLGTDPRTAVMDAESGTLVRGVTGDEVVLIRDGSEIGLSTQGLANLSPDGSLVTIENDDVGQVVDAATGATRRFEHGHEWAVGYQWLDPATLAVLAFDGLDDESSSTAWLMTCDARTGTCDGPGTEIPPAYGDVQLPLGVHFTR